MNALAKFGHHDSSLLKKLCEEASFKVGGFNTQGIANTLNTLAKFGHHHSSLLRKLWEEASFKIGGLNSQGIANTLNALVKFGHRDSCLLRKFCEVALGTGPRVQLAGEALRGGLVQDRRIQHSERTSWRTLGTYGSTPPPHKHLSTPISLPGAIPNPTTHSWVIRWVYSQKASKET